MHKENYALIQNHSELSFSHISFVNKIFMGRTYKNTVTPYIIHSARSVQRHCLMHTINAYGNTCSIYAQRKHLSFFVRFFALFSFSLNRIFSFKQFFSLVSHGWKKKLWIKHNHSKQIGILFGEQIKLTSKDVESSHQRAPFQSNYNHFVFIRKQIAPNLYENEMKWNVRAKNCRPLSHLLVSKISWQIMLSINSTFLPFSFHSSLSLSKFFIEVLAFHTHTHIQIV